MTDESLPHDEDPTAETTAETEADTDPAAGASESTTPPPGGPAAPRRLRRSFYDRMIAGVSGGVAEYFGIDPIIVRLGFVAATLLGGSGIAIYLIAWLVMPDAYEDESPALNALRGGHRAGGRSMVALGLLIIGIVIFTGSVFWLPSRGELFLPLLILAAGIALLVWPSDRHVSDYGWWPYKPYPEGTGVRDELRDADHEVREELRRERDAVRQEWRRERSAWRESRHQWRHGYRRGFVPEGSGGQPPPPPWPPAPPLPPRRRRYRPRPFLGPIAIALLLLFTGLTVLADEVGWWNTDPASFLAICLMIIGAILVVSAFIGRARGLIWLGLLLLPIAWAIGAADLTWWDGMGEERVAVTSIDDLEDEYRWGFGEFHVDLSDLDLEGETVEVAVGLTIGELKVWVPESMAVEVDLDGRIGSVFVTDRGLEFKDDGIDINVDRSVGDSAGGTLLLDADIGIGEAEIIVCGGGSVPCP